jgi:hypothetical protein
MLKAATQEVQPCPYRFPRVLGGKASSDFALFTSWLKATTLLAQNKKRLDAIAASSRSSCFGQIDATTS